jgi:poly(3-hydroxybutyrate) depolymerase
MGNNEKARLLLPCSESSGVANTDSARSGRYVFKDMSGMEREFHLYIPSSFHQHHTTSTVGAKVALLFHGWGANGIDWMTTSAKSEADRLNFVLVAPTGLSDAAYQSDGDSQEESSKTSWNVRGSSTGVGGDGNDVCDASKYTMESSHCYSRSCDCNSDTSSKLCAWTHCGDDVAFVLDLIDQLQQRHLCVDQIYAAGHSNGAMLAWELGMDERTASYITAIAPISGQPHRGYANSFHRDDSSTTTSGSNIPVLLLSGKYDNVIPPGDVDASDPHDYTESTDGSHFYYVSASAIMRVWATAYGCDTNGRSSTVDVPHMGWFTRCTTYCGGDDKNDNNGMLSRALDLDCRTKRGHGQEPWMTRVVLEYFNAHARDRPCELFGTTSACAFEQPRCQWSAGTNQCINWTGDHWDLWSLPLAAISLILALLTKLFAFIGFKR